MVDDIQNSDDTASVFGNLDNNTEPSPAQPSGGDAPSKPERKAVTEDLEKEIVAVSAYIKDLETLVIAKVINKFHNSYYRAWTADLRQAYGLICRLHRRKNEIESKRSGKVPPNLQTG